MPLATRRLALTVATALGVVALYAVAAALLAPEAPLHRVAPDGKNEALVLRGKVGPYSGLWQLDTGYAGPPVLSTSYLATQRPTMPTTSVAAEYAAARANMRGAAVTAEARQAAVDAFVRATGAFRTPRCTMNLAGISGAVTQQADMMVCPPLALGGRASPKARAPVKADVVVTNPLPNSVHILTVDYLLSVAPVCLELDPARCARACPRGAWRRSRPPSRRRRHSLSGGAPVVRVGGGVAFRCTLDTGSPTGVALGRAASRALREGGAAVRPLARHVVQTGVNGERVCGELASARVAVFGFAVDDAAVLCNDADTAGVDGYVGMAFLRGFDLLLTATTLRARRSSQAPRAAAEFERLAAGAAARRGPRRRDDPVARRSQHEARGRRAQRAVVRSDEGPRASPAARPRTGRRRRRARRRRGRFEERETRGYLAQSTSQVALTRSRSFHKSRRRTSG